MDKKENSGSTIVNKKTILVTGSGGQLGNELRVISHQFQSFNFLFTSRSELPIEDENSLSHFFGNYTIDYCVNCAAYTAVDKAESEPEKAFLINAEAPGLLASVCNSHAAKLIHISTDYVYDGSIQRPLKEDDPVGPINIYGASKLKGEQIVLSNKPDALIIRTSWVYSSFGNNFVKTMLRLFREKEKLEVVNDQLGCPTYAADLAEVIMKFVIAFGNNQQYSGIVNFCNQGITTWYDFATAIQSFTQHTNCQITPVSTDQYPTPAKRPSYSVLDTTKIKEWLKIEIPDWKNSLEKCLRALHEI
jgi:dTDP-4-dehydrorhamnose reductase